MRAPQSLCLALGHADMAELALLNQSGQNLDGIFDWILLVDAGALEQIKFLGAAEGAVDGVDAAPQVFRAGGVKNK